MYAEGYRANNRFSPVGLAAAAGINAALIGALLFSAPDPIPGIAPTPFEGVSIELAPPPPPDPVPPPPTERTAATPRPAPAPDAPAPHMPTTTTDGWVAAKPGPTTGDDGYGAGNAGGTGVTVDPPAPPAPTIVAPAVDPRYAGGFQPPYPPSEQRLGNDGRVTVRVLVGPDGRVQRIERVSASSDAFFRATEQQALRRWRFRPATSDGVPQAAWRTMTVTFVLSDQ